jgi:hypothetical protein
MAFLNLTRSAVLAIFLYSSVSKAHQDFVEEVDEEQLIDASFGMPEGDGKFEGRAPPLS